MLVTGAHDRLWKTMGEASYGPALHAKVFDEVYEKAEGEYVTTSLSARSDTWWRWIPPTAAADTAGGW